MQLKCLAALLIFAAVNSPAIGETVQPPEEQPVSGSCTVSLLSSAFQRERCELLTEDGAVPNGFVLVIEHVSAACSTTPERGIYTLALITRMSAEGRTIRNTHIPVAVQASTQDQVRLVGAQKVRIYAGSGTSIEALVSTYESAPAGQTGCDLTFSGVLRRTNQ